MKNETGVIRYTDKENRRTVNFASDSRGMKQNNEAKIQDGIHSLRV